MELDKTLQLIPYDSTDHDHFEKVRAELTGIHSIDKVRFGGSDIGTICGLNQWGYAGKLFHQLIGNWPVEKIDNRAIFFGHETEPINREWYQYWERDVEGFIANKKAGRKVRSVNEITEMVINPQYDFMFCNPDGIIVEDRGLGIFEAKNIGKRHLDQYANGIVRSHYLQVHFNMIVCNLQYGALAYYIDGNDYVAYEFERDAEIDEYILNAVNAFGLKVLKGKMIMQTVSDKQERDYQLSLIEPEADDSSACNDFYSEKYKQKQAKEELDGTFETQDWFDKMIHFDSAKKRAEKLKSLYSNRIKKQMENLNARKLKFHNGHITFGANGALYPKVK
jgi:predicted phage-related endonuclease